MVCSSLTRVLPTSERSCSRGPCIQRHPSRRTARRHFPCHYGFESRRKNVDPVTSTLDRNYQAKHGIPDVLPVACVRAQPHRTVGGHINTALSWDCGGVIGVISFGLCKLVEPRVRASGGLSSSTLVQLLNLKDCYSRMWILTPSDFLLSEKTISPRTSVAYSCTARDFGPGSVDFDWKLSLTYHCILLKGRYKT